MKEVESAEFRERGTGRAAVDLKIHWMHLGQVKFLHTPNFLLSVLDVTNISTIQAISICDFFFPFQSLIGVLFRNFKN